MGIIIRRFRDWWQPPRSAHDRVDHRQVSFLELFYDLVYVAIVAELSHTLSANLTWSGLGRFVFLFIIVWWAWINGTIYHDIHGNNDLRTRIFTFLQMFTVVAMAIFAHDALGGASAGFALAYAAFQLILTYLWWRTGVHDPTHRVFSNPYSTVFLLNTLLFAGSIFFVPPVRFYIWGGALLLSLLLPIMLFALAARHPEGQPQLDRMLYISPSLVERFGLFSIIVLGEVIIGVVAGVTSRPEITWLVGATAALGTLVGIGLWWVYFDFVSHHPPKRTITAVGTWIYLHLVTAMSITAVGASVLNMIQHTGEPLPPEVPILLSGAVAVSLLAIAILTRIIHLDDPLHEKMHPPGRKMILISAPLAGLLGFSGLAPIPLLALTAALLFLPVFAAFHALLRALEEKDR